MQNIAWSDHFSSFVDKVGSLLPSLNSKMQVLVLLLSSALVYGAVSPVKRDAEAEPSHVGYHSGPHCHDKKDHQCHKTPKQQHHEECHVEYDIVVDVTYIEECEYVVITHCEEEHQQVHHNSHIVGHDSQVVDHYQSGHYGHGGYHKRSADPGHQHHCEDKKEMQCHKHPKENSRKIPKQECKKIVDTIYIEQCEERIHTHCEETHEKSHHSTRVVGHESHKVAHGHHDSYEGHH